MSEEVRRGDMTLESAGQAEAAPRAPERGAVRRARPARRPRATVGGVIGRSFRVWSRNFLPFVTITVVVFSPYMALQLWLRTQALDEEIELMWSVLTKGLQFVLGFLVTGTLVYGVFQDLRAQKASAGQILSHGAARVPALLAVSIATGMCIYAPLMPGVLLMLAGLEVLGPLLLLIGLVGMIVIACGLFVAVPASVVERPGVWGALRRSWSLTRGYKLTAFSILFMTAIFTLLLGAIVGGLVALVRGDVYFSLEMVMTVLATSITAVFAAVAYHDIRVSKEGVGTEQLAAIFD